MKIKTYASGILRFLFLLSFFFFGKVQAEGDPSRRFLAADSSKGSAMIIDETGKTQWQYKIGPLHDLHYLNNGNILLQTNWTRIVEVNPNDNRVVWEYDSAKTPGNEGKKIEVHAFQRLPDGSTMLAESGASRIIEVDAAGKLIKQIPLQVSKPHPHRDTRLVRKLDNGHYLVCHEGDGLVREYSAEGKTVWEYAIPLFGQQPRPGHGIEAFGNQCFCALRLPSGNTLISTGNGHRVLEVTQDKEVVWQLTQDDLPGIELAWITSLQIMENGNIVLVNCHAGPKNPQIIEVNRAKQVVWQFKDFDRFGNALTNAVMLSEG